MQQSQHQARPGRAQRMPESNRPTIDVGSFAIETKFLLNREVLRRERFVDFNQVDIRKLQTGFLECLTSCGHRPDAHDLRLDSGIGPANDAAHWFDLLRLDEVLAGDDQCRRAIDYARGISGGDESIFAECRS